MSKTKTIPDVWELWDRIRTRAEFSSWSLQERGLRTKDGIAYLVLKVGIDTNGNMSISKEKLMRLIDMSSEYGMNMYVCTNPDNKDIMYVEFVG